MIISTGERNISLRSIDRPNEKKSFVEFQMVTSKSNRNCFRNPNRKLSIPLRSFRNARPTKRSTILQVCVFSHLSDGKIELLFVQLRCSNESNSSHPFRATTSIRSGNWDRYKFFFARRFTASTSETISKDKFTTIWSVVTPNSNINLNSDSNKLPIESIDPSGSIPTCDAVPAFCSVNVASPFLRLRRFFVLFPSGRINAFTQQLLKIDKMTYENIEQNLKECQIEFVLRPGRRRIVEKSFVGFSMLKPITKVYGLLYGLQV